MWKKRLDFNTPLSIQDISDSCKDTNEKTKRFADFFKETLMSDRNLSVEDLEKEDSEPFILNLQEAVDLTKACIKQGMPISIIGDYDCDGINSSGELKLGLYEYTGVKPEVIIPRRESDGYGVNIQIIDKIPCGLVICVDNGISAIEAIAYAKEKGLKVIILDHHINREDGLYPDADVIVDPCAEKYRSDYQYYCGAGLAYRFIKALNPNTKILDHLIALAGIATVADVVPLKGHNRWLVTKALSNIADRKCPIGLKMLLDALNVNEYVSEGDIGFTIGPCFNAPGRLYDTGGQQMLDFITLDEELIKSDDDLDICLQEAEKIRLINEERKAEVASELQIASSIEGDFNNCLVIEDDRLKKGIVGIVAGDYTEKYGIPSLVATSDPKNPDNYSGSGRSPENLHLKNLLDKAKEYLVGYGGHAGAAGFTVAKANWEQFKRKISELLSNYTPYEAETIWYDYEIEDYTKIDWLALYAATRRLAPYGEGNKEIVFKISRFTGTPIQMGNHHFKLLGGVLNVVGFYKNDEWEQLGKPTCIDVVGTLTINYYKGIISPQIKIIDFQASEEVHTETYNNLASMFVF